MVLLLPCLLVAVVVRLPVLPSAMEEVEVVEVVEVVLMAIVLVGSLVRRKDLAGFGYGTLAVGSLLRRT